MGSTVGEEVVGASLSVMDRNRQRAAITKIIQTELTSERETIALLHQIGFQQGRALIQQQSHAAIRGSSHTRRPDN